MEGSKKNKSSTLLSSFSSSASLGNLEKGLKKSVSFANLSKRDDDNIDDDGDSKQRTEGEGVGGTNKKDNSVYWKRNDSTAELYQEMYWDEKEGLQKSFKNKNIKGNTITADNPIGKEEETKQHGEGEQDSDYWKRNDSSASIYKQFYWENDEQDGQTKDAVIDAVHAATATLTATEATDAHATKIVDRSSSAPLPQSASTESSFLPTTTDDGMKRIDSVGSGMFWDDGGSMTAPPSPTLPPPSTVQDTEVSPGIDNGSTSAGPPVLIIDDNAVPSVEEGTSTITRSESSTNYWKRNDSNTSMYKMIYWDEDEE